MWATIWNTGVQVGGKITTGLLGLVVTMFLTRGLGVDGYGQLSLITAFLVLLDTLADFGTRLIGVREMARGQKQELSIKYQVLRTKNSDGNKKNGEHETMVWSQIVWLRVITTGVAFGLGVGVISWWPGFEGIRVEAVVATIMMWLTMVAGNLEMVWQVKLRMGMKVMGEVVFSVLILMCLFFFKNGLSLMMVLQIYLGARILSLVVAVGWIKRLTEVNKIEKWQKEGIKRLWKEVWPMGVYLLIFVAYDRVVDSLMIERFLGIREVAWYGLAYKMYAVLIMPAYFLMGSAFPLLAKGGENKEGEKKVRWLLMAGAVVIMAVVELVAPSMVEVMGGDGYQPTVWVLRGLMIALFFAYNNHWLGFKLIASGKQKLVLRAGLVALVVNFVGNLWVIPRFGIMGAVAVTGLTELVSSVVLSLRSGS